MNEPDIGDREFTGYTLGMSYTEWLLSLREIPVAELEDRLEIKRWLVIDPDAESDALRYFLVGQIHALIQELERRKKLLKNHGDHPLAPQWKGGTMAKNRDRIDRIKERWPVERFLQQSLGCKLIPKSNGTFMTNCPFPGHLDSTPSFQVDPRKQLGY